MGRFTTISAITTAAALAGATITGAATTSGAGQNLPAAMAPAASAPAVAGVAVATKKVKLRAAIEDLRVSKEKRAGYDRDRFRHWIDADGDCQDTRAEVLRQESKKPVTGSCSVTEGKWVSYYDGETWTNPSDVDIDHMVPLAEAWDSGAKKWNGDTRQRYANDLGDKRSLVAVTDNVNQSKGDRDVAEWLPEKKVCRYVTEWVAVKARWKLTVDTAEKRALRDLAGDCKNKRIKVTNAKVVKGSGGSGEGGAPPPGDGGGVDPRFSTCTAAKAAGFGPYFRGDPEYPWYDDRDNDGIVCE